MAEDRALRDTLEEVQGQVRALRITLAQPEDTSVLAPLERAREALRAQLQQVLAELADLEARRDRRTQALADEGLELTSLRAERVSLVQALVDNLDPGLPEDSGDSAAW